MSKQPTAAEVELRDAELAVDSATEALRESQKRLKEARHAVWLQRFGVRIGSIVRVATPCNAPAEYEVTRLTSWFADRRPAADGRKRRKDGTFGTREFWIGFDYEVVTT